MRDRTIGNVLECLRDRFPSETALVEDDRRYSYRELVSEFHAVGNALRKLGLIPGDRVGIIMKDSADLVRAMYGTLWAGITVVPMNTRLSASDHSYMLKDANVRVLLYHAQTAEHVADVTSDLDIEWILSLDGGIDGGDPRLHLEGIDLDQREPLDVDPDSIAWVHYTGGTTGVPKGVVHTHTTMLSTLFSCALEFEVGPGERAVHVAPLTHAGASLLIPVWLRGGTNILLNGFDADQMIAAIEEHRATITSVVPTMIQVLLETPGLATADLSSLRTMVYGGAPITPDALRRAIGAFGPILLQSYGQVEVFAQISSLSKADHLAALDDTRLLESAGRSVAITEIRIANDDGEAVPDGSFGEILVRGPHMFRKYLNKPTETEAALVNGWLRTGDAGFRDERGYLFITDRKKDVVITGGFNVYPREVENVITLHEQVQECCVVGLPDPKWGEQVTAAVVVRRGIGDLHALAEEIIASVRTAKGPVYAPKSVVFIDAVPLTAVGKYDKKALVRQLLSS